MSVSFVVAVNVPTAVFVDGWAFWLSLHVPLLSFGSSPENRTTALPLPAAPANLPVLWAPLTVNGTVVVNTARQVLVDLMLLLLVPALSKVTVRLPAAVVNVCDWPFLGWPPSVVVPVVLTGPVNVRWNRGLLAIAAEPVTFP